MSDAESHNARDERSSVRDDRSVAPPWVAVLALTAAAWSAQFAMRVSHTAFDLGVGGPLLVEASSAALSAVAGVGLCLALTPILKRVRPGGLAQALGLLLVLTSVVAVAWRILDAVLVRGVMEAASMLGGLDARPSPGLREGGAATWWLFFAWTGMWLASAHGERLREATERVMELENVVRRPAGDEDAIWSSTGRGAARVPVSEIVMLEAERDYVRLHLSDGRSHLVRATLAGLIERMGGERFVRVHRSAAVNRHALTGSRARDGDLVLMLSNGRDVRVGRRRRASVLTALGLGKKL